ncbi:hypothetical protein [Rhodoligotrophos defluvii]|uniref:hypothetical protein n=1 Tax=Rhodoligotrophos defluvii TaxID=2561934 RepID=UPI0010C9AB63|nr:hypothetical protein [Rhodoligotrophos defluvii]
MFRLKHALFVCLGLAAASASAQAYMSTIQMGDMQFAAPEFAVLDRCLEAAGMPADLEKRFFDAINYSCPGDPSQMAEIKSSWDQAKAAGGECPPAESLGERYEAAKAEIEKLIIEADCN